MKKTALILGASGLTGSLLLDKLVDDSRYDRIILISRKSVNRTSSKIEEHIGDLLQLEQFKKCFTVDEVYCCIGTTATKTKDKSIYRAIDFGIPVAAAKLSKANGVSKYLVVSAMGANKDSSIFYNRTKGEMEEAVLNGRIERTYVLRPSLITGERKETRMGERVGEILFKIISPLMINSLRKYRSIGAIDIAQAMINLANSELNDSIILSDRIIKISRMST